MSKRERISPVDTAWLRMDRPTNLMMIVGVMIFDGPMDYARLRRTLEARLLPYRRFRQRVEYDATGAAHWADDPDFDLDRHLHHAALPAGGHKDELQRMAADLISTPLDPNRPLWSFHLVDNYGGGSALVVRIHHCIADGIALIGVMLSLTDAGAEAPERPIPPPEMPLEDGPDPFFWNRVFEPVTQGMIAAINFGTQAWLKYFELLMNPGQAVDYGRRGVGMAAELGNLLIMPADSPTRFKGQPGGTKAVAWTDPMPLAEIKAVGHAIGCSVNDLLLSAVAGALRAYLVEQGDPVDGVEVRALVPVNLRSKADEGKLGNRFGLVTLLLPVYMENPFERVFEVRRRMAELRGSYQPAVALGVLAATGLAPKFVQDIALDILANKASAVMTNVPGPQQPLYMAGARLAQQMFWVPQSGDIGMGVSILSYNGCVQFGLVTDRHFVADPDRIVARFRPEFEKLVYALLLGPWEELHAPEEIRGRLEAELEKMTGRPVAEAAPPKPRKPRATRRKPAASAPIAGAAVAPPAAETAPPSSGD
ncbi:MAG: wax ester/triacylglycerol synthase family O-acyltransferase [Rhodocyclaceae bacterium]|nr:wax ester/triacylglycerol synthase family O-acyltransferase [Rhodocyclaceae bacterium]HNQ58570.1 wax ester/triacylglycerol synthase family O-acyltransferase [Candidatus Desulfobacillus denitrificans]HNT62386.1 wax ester/triacylglycerol synthase family O-acyltransferase [Candidatus Desulfobacillus denitrificans]